MAGRRESLVLAAFFANALLAGGNGVAIRFSNRELAPLWGAGLRFAIAALLLVGLLAALKVALPRGRALAGTLLYGAFQFGGAFGLYYYALLQLHAGFGQFLLALVPLATLLLAVAQGQERLHAATVLGALLGLCGAALLVTDPFREAVPLLSVLAVLGSVLCFAQAAVLVRRFPPVHPVATNAVGMAVGAVLLVGAAAVAGEALLLPSEPATWAALAYVVAFGSIGVFVLFVFVVQHWSASRAAYVMVLIPFITLALSARLDGEPVGTGLVVGGVLILAGVYLGALRAPAAA